MVQWFYKICLHLAQLIELTAGTHLNVWVLSVYGHQLTGTLSNSATQWQRKTSSNCAHLAGNLMAQVLLL